MSFPKDIYMCVKTLDKVEVSVNRWKHLNPEYEIKVYDDEMCETFLLENYGQTYKDIFQFLSPGPIKADFWRICILYLYGGVYCDVDILPFYQIEAFLEIDVDFVTCSSYDRLVYFNPNFIISSKGNIILKNAIDWYLNKYDNNVHNGNYWEYSIMTCFQQTLKLDNFIKNQDYDGVYNLGDMKVQIINEKYDNFTNDYNEYKGMKVFNNRCEDWDFSNHCFR